jgi:hypothetical protein
MNKLINATIAITLTVLIFLAGWKAGFSMMKSHELKAYQTSRYIVLSLIEGDYDGVGRIRNTIPTDLFEAVVLDFVFDEARRGNCREAEELVGRQYLTGNNQDKAQCLVNGCFEELERLYQEYCTPEAEADPTSL